MRYERKIKMVTRIAELKQVLNDLIEQGWRLVSAVRSPGDDEAWILFLRRPLKD